MELTLSPSAARFSIVLIHFTLQRVYTKKLNDFKGEGLDRQSIWMSVCRTQSPFLEQKAVPAETFEITLHLKMIQEFLYEVTRSFTYRCTIR